MILVTGATGLNGRELVHRLSARGVPTRALVRNATRADALSSLPNIEIVEGDMARPETLAPALHSVDQAMLISSSDPAMLDVQSNFIEAARKAGVKHVVKLSGIMPELDSPFRFARMHAEIERRLEASGMAFTHLRAGEFMPTYFRQVPSIIAQGNESRLTSQRPQDLQQVFRIPSGALAASLDGSIVCGLAHQVEGEVADYGHVFGAVTGAQA